ncbi:MAG: 2Fe-2S iron-sulfur cluster-binding protein [Pseudomonadota bacterium]
MSEATKNFQVVIRPQGWAFSAAAGQTLLDAARTAGIIMPSSCRNGTCRSCMCFLLKGDVQYQIEWPGLSREEKAEGYILPCVASAESDLELDVSRATRA